MAKTIGDLEGFLSIFAGRRFGKMYHDLAKLGNGLAQLQHCGFAALPEWTDHITLWVGGLGPEVLQRFGWWKACHNNPG